MKETLEEMVTRITAENKRLTARLEESEYRHAVTCEALEEVMELSKYDGISWRLDKCYVIAKNVLNGVFDDD